MELIFDDVIQDSCCRYQTGSALTESPYSVLPLGTAQSSPDLFPSA